ncbi:hypothetical protein K439DRAFT_1292271, partial [Ramaria rubella]
AQALTHMERGGKALAISHAESPSSIYNNPQLYPQVFPWLFPYGLRGLCNEGGANTIPDKTWKKHLLLYHDKHFQEDPSFPLIAFNHEQIKGSTTGGFLMAEKHNFDQISKRLMSLNKSVLVDMTDRMIRGDCVKPQTDEEKACFQIIKDLDHVASKVKGSGTTRKFMNNKLWSMVYSKGSLTTPTWYITFAPADERHPIALHMAGHYETCHPTIIDDNTWQRLLSNNQVASARFFNFMVSVFLKHILRVGNTKPGLWGTTSSYYGMVEQ